MKVHFSVVEELLDELRHEQHDVEDGIVRLTFHYEQSMQVQFIYHVSVIAGFVVRGKLIYLKQACGDVWQGEQVDKGQKSKEMAERIAQQIEAPVQQMGLALRRGMFELV